MNYIKIIVAYGLIALFVGLVFLFPDRPVSVVGFLVLAGTVLPIVAIFDMIAQKIIDSTPSAIRPFAGIVALAAFLGSVYLVVDLIGLAVKPW